MKENNKVLITAVVLILLFGGILFVFNKKGYLSFSGKETTIVNDVDNTKNDTVVPNNVTDCTPTKCDCDFDTSISDYDTIQEVNKFWNKLIGKWSNGFYDFIFWVNNGLPMISSGKHYSEVSAGIIVSIKKEDDNIYTFNVVRAMSSWCGKEKCDKSDEMKLSIDEWNIVFDSSFTFDVSNLDNGNIKDTKQEDWVNNEDAVFKRVND